MKRLWVIIMLASLLYANEGEDTSTDEEEEDWPRIPFGATLFLGYYNPSFKDITDEYNKIGSFDTFKGKVVMAIDVRYLFNSKWQMGWEFRKTDFSTTGYLKGDTIRTELKVETTLHDIFVERKIPLSSKTYMTVKAGGGVVLGSYSVDSGFRKDSNRYIYKWSGLGGYGLIGLGLEYRYRPGFALSVRCSYLYGGIPSSWLQPEAGVPKSKEPVGLMVTGPVFQIGPQLNF